MVSRPKNLDFVKKIQSADFALSNMLNLGILKIRVGGAHETF